MREGKSPECYHPQLVKGESLYMHDLQLLEMFLARYDFLHNIMSTDRRKITGCLMFSSPSLNNLARMHNGKHRQRGKESLVPTVGTCTIL